MEWLTGSRFHDPTKNAEEHVDWKKSSWSNASGNCIEVARGKNLVWIQNSKDPDGRSLAFTAKEWDAFVSGVKAGEFDA